MSRILIKQERSLFFLYYLDPIWGKHSNSLKLPTILVGGAITILKNDRVRQWEKISHILWKIKAMFETTNQILFHHC